MSDKISRKRKPGAGRKPNIVPTKAIRLPRPWAEQLEKIKNITFSGIEEIGLLDTENFLPIPLFSSRVQAGFPSPVDDIQEGTLDLNSYLIKHKGATFFVRVIGESMINVGIFPGDILIVDKALPYSSGKIVIAVLNGEMTVKRLRQEKGQILLISENDNYPSIPVGTEDDFSIWGVVTNVIHALD